MEPDRIAHTASAISHAGEDEDTIAAIATPPGEGGVGIVRLSGPRAIDIAVEIFASSRGIDPKVSTQRVFHGYIHGEGGAPLDEVLLHLMRAPHSFTREDVAEINAHGGAGPLNAILEEVLRRGARLAGPGEFTLRAFLNGRIDLVQAEAVIDQIQARTKAGLQAANAAARGVLSQTLHRIGEMLAGVLARVEASVDFSEDEVPDPAEGDLAVPLCAAAEHMRELLNTADAGRLYREGAVIAIAGRPNVGKSSLFNALLRDVRAIVSAHAGTTRDRLEEYITLAGAPVKLVDTAGMRATDHEIERLGVELARETLREAHLVLFVIDSTAPDTPDDRTLAGEMAALEAPVVCVLNKCDAAPEAEMPAMPFAPLAMVRVSALRGDGLKTLEERLGEHLLGGAHWKGGEAMINRAHQKDSLRRALESVERVLDQPEASPEFLALDLREALHALGEITGETTPEDLLARIFSSFCIGK